MSNSPTVARLVLIAGAVVLLEFLCRYGFVSPTNLIPPSKMTTRLYEIMHEGEFWEEARSTFHNVFWAVTLAMSVGATVGLTLYRLPRVRRTIEPLIASYYSLPFFVFYPLAIVIFGMNDAPIILMGFLFAVVAMISNTMNGVDRIPMVLTKVGKSFRLGLIRSAFFLQFPASVPHLFTGVKLALGYSVSGVIGSEFILSGSGLGYSIAYAYNNFDTSRMYALLLFLILVVAALLFSLHSIERRLTFRAGSSWTIASQTKTELRTLSRTGDVAILLLVFLAAWQFLHFLAGSEALASPEMTATRFLRMAQTSRFWGHVVETARALGISLVLAILGGGILGIVLGTNRRAGEIFEPMIVALQSTPKVTLYPVMLLFFGLGLAAKVAFGVIHGFIPMTLITLNAVRNMNPALTRTARALRLTRLQTLVTVCMPAVLPEAVTAIRLSFSITFLGVMIGEMFASQRGLGFLIMGSIGLNDVSSMMAVTMLIAATAILANGGMLALDRRLHR